MIKFVVKRDGRTVDFSPSSLNKWGAWAAQSLGSSVDWSSVVLEAASSLPETVTSKQLQERLIKACLDRSTWSYNRMAGRLYASLIHKNLYDEKFPTIQELHQKMYDDGLMVKLDYSDEEYAELQKLIDHKLDFKAAHFQIHQALTKYSLQNRVDGIQYESPQFVYMRCAMALAEDQPKHRRLEDAAKWYSHFSKNKINMPTPNLVNLGSPLRGYASCCVYKAGDTAHSLAIGDHIADVMTFSSAGIGSNIECRSLGDAVRNGVIQHQGKLPYYRALQSAIHKNLQNGRGGAATVHFPIYDPEVMTLIHLKNPMSTEDRKIRGLDYSVGINRFFVRKAAKGEKFFTFNVKTAPDLNEAFYGGDEKKFAEIYEKYENDPLFPKNYLDAREVLIEAVNQSYETGRIYLFFPDEMNHHTPFLDTIYSSNLC